MAGHSKWKNIAHRKGKQDASRGQLFTKLCRDVYAAARRGGSNPDTNYQLKIALEKAREASVPSDTLARTLAKASGTLEGMQFEDFLYEGYGPGGIAIMLELSSSNRNRTAAEIRHLFSKHGGSLGESGCVAWMFKRVGAITVSQLSLSADDFMLLSLESGAEDVTHDAETLEYTVYTAPDELMTVAQELRQADIAVDGMTLLYVPTTLATVPVEEEERVATLLSLLEEHDDVQSLYTNADFAISDSPQ
ncbi:MAG: YebC/PmpR family DNA-binding transcriptional regulator [Firmicutes bacterium]|nr:YebC/PmpR family DNA-binding transcriptional regulator [Bacillota bacterium]